jgi:hypothetical protein
MNLDGYQPTIIPARSIGLDTDPINGNFFVDQVTISEEHEDEMEITQHPVEQGAAISDHAYRQPAELELTCGWSNSGAAARRDENYVETVYQRLLALQQLRVPFSIVTGKRLYRNMLISSLAVTTNQHTETTLMVRARCREVIIVETAVTTLPPPASQANPAKTQEAANRGEVQPLAQSVSRVVSNTTAASLLGYGTQTGAVTGGF